MIDRKKVIKGLDSCAKWVKENDGDACENCPYHPSHFSYDNNDCYAALYNDAIVLLKWQEPVKPINSYGTLRCGNCNNIVGYNDGNGRGYQNNYCSECGKAVKWND